MDYADLCCMPVAGDSCFYSKPLNLPHRCSTLTKLSQVLCFLSAVSRQLLGCRSVGRAGLACRASQLRLLLIFL